MSTFKNPVGPQPSSVYWRRRLLVGLGVLAVAIIIILIIVRPGSGAPTPASSNAPASSGTAETPATDATAAPPTGDGTACDPAKVTLEANTDAGSYDPGVNPKLSFSLKSLMTEPCTIAVGSDVQEYRITSGEELIWSSKDCQTDAVAANIELQPGVPFGGPALEWGRTATNPDGCDTPGAVVVADGASYHLEVKVGDLTSQETKQFLLY
ncbi:MAG: hypothetical protein ACOH19_14930 [Rhodoglobus sp.]